LRGPPVELTLDLQRLNGDLSSVGLLFPDEVSELGLKAFATSVRMKATDIVDVWRCLEIWFGAGVTAAQRSPESYSTAEAALGCGR
jgi:hypothetical protein